MGIYKILAKHIRHNTWDGPNYGITFWVYAESVEDAIKKIRKRRPSDIKGIVVLECETLKAPTSKYMSRLDDEVIS